MAAGAHMPAGWWGDEEPTVSALLAAESLIVQNKANLNRVSSLKFRASSSGPALQTSHVTVHTPLKPSYGVSRACRAKQSQLNGVSSLKSQVSSGRGLSRRTKPIARGHRPSPATGWAETTQLFKTKPICPAGQMGGCKVAEDVLCKTKPIPRDRDCFPHLREDRLAVLLAMAQTGTLPAIAGCGGYVPERYIFRLTYHLLGVQSME